MQSLILQRIESEYESLRKELEINRKYIFERPLVILSVGIAAIGFLSKDETVAPLINILLPTMMLLCLFSLWFTVNRLTSSARIIAYIQLCIESVDFNTPKYFGWENFLRNYRIYKNSKSNKALDQLINNNKEVNAFPNSFRVYPLVLIFHIAFGGIIIVISSSQTLIFEGLNLSKYSIITSWAIFFVIIIYCSFFTNVKESIERERIIIKHVLDFIKSNKHVETLTKTKNIMGTKITKSEIYEQGSKSCQQYSQLTMQIRTMALNIFIGYSGGILIILANAKSLPAYIDILLISGGVVLLLFAIVLGILNHHYSTAHNAIREDSLVPIEEDTLGEEKKKGSWSAHQKIRDEQGKFVKLSWYAPFFVLGLIGFASLVFGIIEYFN